MYIAGAMPKTPSRAKMNKVNHPKCFLIPEMENLNRILRMASDGFILEKLSPDIRFVALLLPLSKSPKLIFSSRLQNGSEGQSPAPIHE